MTDTAKPFPKTTSVELLPDRVIKRFCAADAFWRELEVYQKHLAVTPRLLDNDAPHSITMERIDGIPYLDTSHRIPTKLLAEAISMLHNSRTDNDRCLCHVDNQPKNILLGKDRVYLIDFADAGMDLPEADISHLMLFWAEQFTYQQMETLCHGFLDAYHGSIPLSALRWTKCLPQSIERFDARRRMFRSQRPHPHPNQTLKNRELLKNLATASGLFS